MPLDPILKKRIAVPSSAAQFYDGYKIRPLFEQQKQNFSTLAQAEALAAAIRPYNPLHRVTLKVQDSIDSYPGYFYEHAPGDDPRLFELFGEYVIPATQPEKEDERFPVVLNVGASLYQLLVNQGLYNRIRTEPTGERPVLSVEDDGAYVALSWIK